MAFSVAFKIDTFNDNDNTAEHLWTVLEVT